MTDQGTWAAPTVVLASGACNRPNVPAFADAVPSSITTLTAMDYHGADQLPDGGVLVVGAGATAVQLADEIHHSGRPVTLSAGEHVRLPRTYRGCDIFSWMESVGVLDERFDAVDDITRARHVPSPQLIGSPDRRAVDLNALTGIGVRIVGRLGRIADGRAQFAGSLANVCTLADLKMNRLLTPSTPGWEEPRANVQNPHGYQSEPTLELALTSGEIRTIVWATGYRPDHSWLDVPVLRPARAGPPRRRRRPRCPRPVPARDPLPAPTPVKLHPRRRRDTEDIADLIRRDLSAAGEEPGSVAPVLKRRAPPHNHMANHHMW